MYRRGGIIEGESQGRKPAPMIEPYYKVGSSAKERNPVARGARALVHAGIVAHVGARAAARARG